VKCKRRTTETEYQLCTPFILFNLLHSRHKYWTSLINLFQIFTIDLNFLKLIQIYFTAHSIGTTDDTVSSVVMFKSEVYIIFTM